jgi:hypothetical protein
LLIPHLVFDLTALYMLRVVTHPRMRSGSDASADEIRKKLFVKVCTLPLHTRARASGNFGHMFTLKGHDLSSY